MQQHERAASSYWDGANALQFSGPLRSPHRFENLVVERHHFAFRRCDFVPDDKLRRQLVGDGEERAVSPEAGRKSGRWQGRGCGWGRSTVSQSERQVRT